MPPAGRPGCTSGRVSDRGAGRRARRSRGEPFRRPRVPDRACEPPVGWSEVLVILAVAVLVIGPKDLPRALYTLGKIVRKIKVFTGDIQKLLDKVKELEKTLESRPADQQHPDYENIKVERDKLLKEIEELKKKLEQKPDPADQRPESEILRENLALWRHVDNLTKIIEKITPNAKSTSSNNTSGESKPSSNESKPSSSEKPSDQINQ